MKITLRHIILLSIGMAFMIACEPNDDFRTDTSVEMGVTLQGTLLSEGKTTTFTTWDSITAQGVGNDSILYSNRKAVSRLLLPLRIDTSVSAYTLLYRDAFDTLYIQHTNEPSYLSLTNGIIVLHKIEKAWSSGKWIDSLAVINESVMLSPIENIRLYTHHQ